jgi:hypothetical protein
MVSREAVYAALTKEDGYAQAWAKGKKSKVDGVPDHMVSRKTGFPFSEIEWVNFAELYLDEAKKGHANFVPDTRAITIRLLKAASMLIAAIQTSATEQDLADIAGVSRTKFPTMTGGLATFKAMVAADATAEDKA